MKELSITVLGPGGVGGFLAGVLVKEGFCVTCVTSDASVEIIKQDGLRIESKVFGDFTVHPKVATKLESEPDILFVTTKTTTLKNALDRVDPCLVGNSVVVPLLNGIEHMQILRSRYGDRVVAATIGNFSASKVSPNHIIHTTPSAPSAHVEMASDGDIPKSELLKISDMLAKVNITVDVLNSESVVLWRKLIRLNAIACTTSASDRTIGFIKSDKWWRKKLEGCVIEGINVSNVEGVEMNSETVMEQIDHLPDGLTTSMQRDINAGNPSEIDAIAGAVVRAGKRHGISCPTIEELMNIIQDRIETISNTL